MREGGAYRLLAPACAHAQVMSTLIGYEPTHSDREGGAYRSLACGAVRKAVRFRIPSS